jgi:hypothetical protein
MVAAAPSSAVPESHLHSLLKKPRTETGGGDSPPSPRSDLYHQEQTRDIQAEEYFQKKKNARQLQLEQSDYSLLYFITEFTAGVNKYYFPKGTVT